MIQDIIDGLGFPVMQREDDSASMYLPDGSSILLEDEGNSVWATTFDPQGIPMDKDLFYSAEEALTHLG